MRLYTAYFADPRVGSKLSEGSVSNTVGILRCFGLRTNPQTKQAVVSYSNTLATLIYTYGHISPQELKNPGCVFKQRFLLCPQGGTFHAAPPVWHCTKSVPGSGTN